MSVYYPHPGFHVRPDNLAVVLEAARNNDNLRERCHSLAEVAFHTVDLKDFRLILEESLDAARLIQSPGKAAFAAASPIAVMVERQHGAEVGTVLEFLRVAGEETDLVCRGEGLSRMFEAVYPDLELRRQVLADLVDCCLQMRSWRRNDFLSEAAITLSLDDEVERNRVLALIDKPQFVRRAFREIEAGVVGPHCFFPYWVRMAGSK